MSETITPPAWRWAAEAHYAQAVRTGDLILTCGVAPFDDDGALVGPGDFDRQFRQTVANLSVLLEEAGSGLDRILRQQVFLRREQDLDRFRALRAELYRPPYPASVLLVVTAHAHPGMLVEIACEALGRPPA